MPVVKLTRSVITALPRLGRKEHEWKRGQTQEFFWDTEVRRFGVQVGRTGVKSYVVRGAKPGQSATIGAVTEVSLEKARARALEIRGAWGDGRNLAPSKRRRKYEPTPTEAATLRSCLKAFTDARSGGTKPLRPATLKGYAYTLEKYLPDWLDVPMVSITPAMVIDRHKRIREEAVKRKARGKLVTGGATANGVMYVLSIMWRFAQGMDWLDRVNPVERLAKMHVLAPKVRRKGVITEVELPKWYAAVDALATSTETANGAKRLPSQHARALFLFMLFTGIRRTQARTMRWENVDLDRRLLRFSGAQTKGKRDITLPMSDYVHDLLDSLPRDPKSPYVFIDDRGGPVGTRRAQRAVEGVMKDGNEPRAADAPPAFGRRFMLHDLRRTFAEACRAVRLHPDARAYLLDHALPATVTTGYLNPTGEDYRDDANSVAHHLIALIEGRRAEEAAGPLFDRDKPTQWPAVKARKGG